MSLAMAEVSVSRRRGCAALRGKVDEMHRLLFALAFALMPLAVGCQSSPPSAPNATANRNTLALKTAKTKHELAIEAIRKRRGAVQIDPDDENKAVVLVDLNGFSNAVASLDSLAPLTKLRDVNLHNTGFTDADLEHLRGLYNLQTLNLSDTKVSDAGLAVLQTLPNLHTVHLDETRITDAGLQYLRGVPNLQELSLYGTKVTDQGLAQLSAMKTLQKLVLGGTSSITDKGMVHLESMSQLHDLTVLSSRVTRTGFEDLQIASPQLKITK
jgi:hypothetical protein